MNMIVQVLVSLMVQCMMLTPVRPAVTEQYDQACYSMVECQYKIQQLHDKLDAIASQIDQQNSITSPLDHKLNHVISQNNQHKDALDQHILLQNQQTRTIDSVKLKLDEQNTKLELIDTLLVDVKKSLNIPFFPAENFLFVSEARNWTDARDNCKMLGGDLVSVQTTEKLEYLNSRISTYEDKDICAYSHGGYYISANKREKKWVWGDSNDPVIYKWGPWEPSGDGNCAWLYFFRDYKLEVTRCTSKHCYICEFS